MRAYLTSTLNDFAHSATNVPPAINRRLAGMNALNLVDQVKCDIIWGQSVIKRKLCLLSVRGRSKLDHGASGSNT